MKTLIKVLDFLFFGGWNIGVPLFKFVFYFALTCAAVCIETIPQEITGGIGLSLTFISLIYHISRRPSKQREEQAGK